MIVERDKMLVAIKQRLDEAALGTGSLVLLGGEAGSGKTSVAREVVARWGRNLAVSHGACDPLTTARPLGPILEIATHDELRLGHVVGGNRPVADLASGLVDEFTRMPGAALVVIEDLHWADDGTLDVVRYLARRIDRTRAVVLATYRTDGIIDDHRLAPVLGDVRRMASTVHLRCEPLSLDAVRRLADDLDANLDPGMVHRLTGGNAFFVTELLATDRPPSEVPGNVEAAVLTRIAGLSTGGRYLVQATAVSPRSLEYDHALALSGADAGAVDEALATGVLSLERGRFAFRHELARLAVESTTPAGRKREYHRALIERLTAGADDEPGPTMAVDVFRIAHHAIEVGDAQLILRYALPAADEAEARGSNRQACQFLTHVLAAADDVEPEKATDWRIRLGSLLRPLGDLRAAIERLDEAADDCRRRSDPARLSVVLRVLSSAHRDIGERTTAESLADRAVVAAEESGDPLVLSQALTQRGFLAMLARHAHSAVDLAGRGLQVAEQTDDPSAVADAEHALACANLIGGDEDSAIAHLSRLEAEAADRGDIARRGSLAVNLGSGCGEVRRYEEAVPWLETAERLARSVDMDQVGGYAAAWLARVAFETGRWDDVAGHVRRAVEDVDLAVESADDTAVGQSYVEVTALGALGRCRVRRGDPGGREVLVKAMKLAADHDIQYLWPVACGLAEDALWRADIEGGIAWLAPIHERAMATESAWARGETSFWMARLGALDSTVPDPVAEPFAESLAGRWQKAADVWRARGCPYEEALALLDSDQAGAVGRALTILDDLGARPAAQLARKRLRALGQHSIPAMPRSSTAANPASLTNRQREVLELLVEGASNQEIAERLFVSKKTVEHHVSAVYGKLAVSDRPSAMVAGRRLLADGPTPS